MGHKAFREPGPRPAAIALAAAATVLSTMHFGARPAAHAALPANTLFSVAAFKPQAAFPAARFEPPAGAPAGASAQLPSPSMAGPFVLGESVQKRPITYYTFGNGPVKRLLVGGIHGGYEFNTVRLMTRTIEHLRDNPSEIPPQVTLYVVANMNPDGSMAGADRINGRLNANKVDLNRNWDYQWQLDAFHGKSRVSGGGKPFSEPESESVRAFIEDNQMDAVIFYHSAFNGVFQGAVVSTTKTLALATMMARVTGYRHLPNGIPGQFTTGNAIDYLAAKAHVTAIEIELLNRQDIDWARNLRGIRFFLKWDLAGRSDAEKQKTADDHAITVRPL